MKPAIETLKWQGPGYQPLVFFGGWQVAVLNWENSMAPDHICEIERHCETDEVFILGQGKTVLYTESDHSFQMIDMEPGVIYNVPKGTWHNLVATKDASLWIIENRDTHLHDTEIRTLEAIEKEQVRNLLPDWVSEAN